MKIIIGLLIGLLFASGIAILVLSARNKRQLFSIQNYENEISNLKGQIETTEDRLAADYKAALDSKIRELEEKHAMELEDVQCKIEACRDVLYQKNEKDLLVDIMLGLGALSKSQETISNKIYSGQEDVKSIKENLFNIGDSVLTDISKGHAETMAKLGVNGDMTIASILADILELMSKK